MGTYIPFPKQRFRLVRSVVLLACLSMLTACGETGREGLEGFVAKVKAKRVRPVTPLPEPKIYEPVPYAQGEGRNPFAPVVLVVVDAKKKVSEFQPDLSRPREELEQFSLRELKLVGTLKKSGELVGLVNTPQGEVVIVHKGSYMGKNFGLVQSVSDSELELREIVKDNEGLWQKRLTRFGFEE